MGRQDSHRVGGGVAPRALGASQRGFLEEKAFRGLTGEGAAGGVGGAFQAEELAEHRPGRVSRTQSVSGLGRSDARQGPPS